MGLIGKREKELMDYLESVVHHYVLTQDRPETDCRKPEIRIIEILGKSGPMKMTEVAEQAMLSLSTVTGLMDSLVEKSLVERTRSEEDRRVVRVALTPEGQEIFEESLAIRLRMVRGMLGSLNSKEQETLVGLFFKMVQKIERERRLTAV